MLEYDPAHTSQRMLAAEMLQLSPSTCSQFLRTDPTPAGRIADRDSALGFSLNFSSVGGPTSPLSPEELRDMSPDDLIEYLRKW